MEEQYSVFDHVVLGFETDREGLLEVVDLLSGQLLGLLGLLFDLLLRLIARSAGPAAAGDRAGCSAICGALTRIIVGDLADQGAPCCATYGAFGACSCCGLGGLLLGGFGRCLILLGFGSKVKWVGTGVLGRPAVTGGFVLGLLGRILPCSGEDVDFEGGGQALRGLGQCQCRHDYQ